MIRRLHRAVALFAIATVLVVGVAGCASASPGIKGPSYLQSLEKNHTIDAKAKAVCERDSGTPTLAGAAQTKVVVAADSSLAFVRKLQVSGYAAKMGQGDLTGTREGYAAICLLATTSNGEPVKLWEYALTNRHSGFINAG